MTPKEIIRTISIKFAHFLTTECFYNINGYMIYPDELEDKLDNNEYEIDELYDYWIDNVYYK